MTERMLEYLIERREFTLDDIEKLLKLTNNDLAKQLYQILKDIHSSFSQKRIKIDTQAQKIIREILVILEIINSAEEKEIVNSFDRDGYIDEVYDTLDNMMDSSIIDTHTRILIYFFFQRIVRNNHHILFISPIFSYTVMEDDFAEHMIFLRTKYLESTGLRTERELLKHLREKLTEILSYNKYNFNFDNSELYYQRNGLIPLLCGSLGSKAKSLVPFLLRILREFIIQYEDQVSLEELTSEIRICTVWALKEINGEEVIDALIKGLRYEYNMEYVHVSVVCAWALGELQAEEAIKHLFFAKHGIIGYFYSDESGNLNTQLIEQAGKSLQNMGIMDDGLEYLYDGIRNSVYEFDDFVSWIYSLSEESILKVKQKLQESDSKEILEDSWWILITHYEYKRLSDDELEKEILNVVNKRMELLPILKEITVGARNGIRLRIKNQIMNYENH